MTLRGVARALLSRAMSGITSGRRRQVDATAALGMSALEALRVGVVVLDEHDHVLIVNPSARRFGIVQKGGGVDRTILALAAQVRRSGRSRRIELDLPGGEGSRPGVGRGGPCGVGLRVVALPGGHVAIEAADMTEAHRLSRVRRDFVANVSHELKTPIGALRLLAEALIEASGSSGAIEPHGVSGAHGASSGAMAAVAPAVDADRLPDIAAIRRFANRIQHESTRLGRLVSDLLELTRIQGAEPLSDPEPVPLDGVIAEIVDRTSTPAAARHIEVTVEGQRGIVVYGNESQFRTALANLVENAIAYSPEDTRVTISATCCEGTAVVEVSDQGIGIEPKDIDRIFERFYRADKARSRVTGGTGLGLAIVKHIATNHGGRVDVVSAVGKGSVFTLRLPTVTESAERG